MNVPGRLTWAAIFASLAAHAMAEPGTGSITAAACVSCHGVDGRGNAAVGIPALAQLPRDYFVKQIADFQSGKRKSPIGLPPEHQLDNSEIQRSKDPEAAADFWARWMVGVAKGLSLEDARKIAGYYETVKRESAKASPPAGQPATINPATIDPAVLERGKSLAINGDWDREIPPCFKCHAIDGVGAGPNFPPLAGQHADYTARQLKAWRTGVRANDPLGLMKRLSKNLTDEEIRSVSIYLATLAPQEKTNE